jgi:hypothetical protein
MCARREKYGADEVNKLQSAAALSNRLQTILLFARIANLLELEQVCTHLHELVRAKE